MRIVIGKAARVLVLYDGDRMLLQARIALGREPVGAKRREGDGRTPEGLYSLCLEKERGKYGLSLGLSYPNAEDAQAAFANGIIDASVLRAIVDAANDRRRPPWGTLLGGEIYLHEGPTDQDWTQGCIALAPKDMAMLWQCRQAIESVVIQP